jgi:hypothetical protein
MNSKWWTLGSAYRLEVDHLRAVIDASLSLMKAGQVESAESLLGSFSSELAEVRSSINQDVAVTWPSSGQTNGRSAL